MTDKTQLTSYPINIALCSNFGSISYIRPQWPTCTHSWSYYYVLQRKAIYLPNLPTTIGSGSLLDSSSFRLCLSYHHNRSAHGEGYGKV